MIVINKVNNNSEIDELCQVADEIWHEHYTPIIGKEQVLYMLDKFQSPKAVKNQIIEGYEYYSLYLNKTISGYLSIQKRDNTLFLSKIYLLSKNRGKGLGKKMMDFIIERAINLEVSSITLTVNKYNENSIKAYEKMGFENIDSVVQDIGQGYVMDDFVMRKVL